MIGVYLAIALGLVAGATLVGGLVWTIVLLRRITGHLATIHPVLRQVAERTDPVGEYVAGIGTNVRSLAEAVAQALDQVRTRVPGPDHVTTEGGQ